ncbi:hypothetical protein ACFOOJ_06310 [Sphingobium xenophagum]|nr:hypothetical protein [Sphingobium xenophagum]
MSDFYSERVVKVRKPRHCDGCGTMLAKGEQALTYSGRFNGDFGSFSHHLECRQAELALNMLVTSGFDEWYALSEIEPDDWKWLLAEFPIVAARKNITAERIREYDDEQKRLWEWRMEESRKREAARRRP